MVDKGPHHADSPPGDVPDSECDASDPSQSKIYEQQGDGGRKVAVFASVEEDCIVDEVVFRRLKNPREQEEEDRRNRGGCRSRCCYYWTPWNEAGATPSLC